jgi:sialate O-acetylesterase
MNKCIAAISLTLLLCIPGFAALKLPYIISDNMLLQREKPARIWGWADAGATVRVEFTGQIKSTTAADNGKWLVALDPMPASAEGRVMTITNGAEQKTIKNILVGEVWQASGQSNMQWAVIGETHWPEAQNFPANNQIRLFKQERTPKGKPADNTSKAAWVVDENQFSRRHFSAVAYYFARNLQESLGVPVGISLAAEGGTKCQYWTPIEAFESKTDYKNYLELAQHARENFKEIKQTFETDVAEYQAKRKAGEKTGPHPTHYGRYPSYYYNGNIHPIRDYTIRGALWYQGERNSINTRDAYEYRNYFPLMIESWRAAFRNPEMPFYFVQLPKMGERDQRDNPVTRESQLLTAQTLHKADMVVGFDKGEASLHPKTKRFLGERLASLALADTYGQDIEYRFPLYKRAEIQGRSIIVHFEHADRGLNASDGQALREFTICGEDQKFVKASAKIVVNTIMVSSPTVTAPVAVRYGWSNAPDVNLISVNGLPASPFRTDDFELPEKNPRQKNYTNFQ